MSEHPKSSPQTLDLNLVRRWSIVRPRLYRHLDAKYVESFFGDGSLRLSSFARFAEHPDEQLRDKGIGSRFAIGSKATIAMVGGRGRDCYVLCASLHNTEEVRKQFGYNACIAIDNIIGFANAVSLKLPYFTHGIEGPVIYQDKTTTMHNRKRLTSPIYCSTCSHAGQEPRLGILFNSIGLQVTDPIHMAACGAASRDYVFDGPEL
jgi:hypothetical protein